MGLTITALPARTRSLPTLGSEVPAEALAAAGYREVEHLVTGTAPVFGPADPGSTAPLSLGRGEIVPLGAVVRDDVPFTTRILVRAPVDATRFSGTVIVEVLHNAGEMAPSWSLSHRHFLEHGDAWIGVTVSTGAHVGIDGEARGGTALLRRLEPERYGALHLEAGANADWPLLAARDLAADLEGKGLVDVLADSPFGGGTSDGTAFGVLVEEIYRTYAHSPDVVGQLADLVRSGDPASPLAGYDVARLYGTGASGTAIWWNAYVDGGHHDRHPFDAYAVFVASPPRTRPTGAVLVSVLSEAEALLANAQGEVPPPDTDEPRFRQYEVAGTGHRLSGGDEPGGLGGRSDALAEHSTTAADDLPAGLVPFDRVTYPVVHELWRRLERWVAGGEPMPPGLHLERDPASPDGLARDEVGNALGGVRTPWVDAPDARYVARSPTNPLRACIEPLPSRPEGYEDSFRAAVERLVATGAIRPEDAALFAPVGS